MVFFEFLKSTNFSLQGFRGQQESRLMQWGDIFYDKNEDCLKFNALKTQKLSESKSCFLTAVITYEVVVYTGDRWAASTDANVYVTIFGSHGDSGKRYLQHSRNNDAKFKRNQVFIVFFSFKIVIVLIYFFHIVCDFLV